MPLHALEGRVRDTDPGVCIPLNRSLWPAILMLTLALAGCLGADETPDPAAAGDEVPAATPPAVPDHDFSTAVGDLHAHENPALHMGGFGLERLAWNDLTDGALSEGIVTGQYNEVDTCGTIASVASFAGNRGFTLVDLADPSKPKVLSQFPTASTNWDVRISDDCSTVFVGMELGDQNGNKGTPVAMAGLQDAGRGGILVVDISEPTDPKLESYNEVGSSHNVFTRDINGTTYVFNEHAKVMRLDGERGSRSLTVLTKVPGTHDVSVEFHPETGVPYMFTGRSDLSIFSLEPLMTLPAGKDVVTLERVGQFEREKGSPNTAWHEQSPAPAMIDGRWVLVGAGENMLGLAEPYSVFDITDPSSPQLVGDWTIPGAPWESRGFYIFSPHNIAVREDGRVAVANYHAGVWVFDISTQERQAEPVTLGYDMPAEVSPLVARSLPYAPYVWGGEWLETGELVTADLNSGLYTYAVE